MRCLPAATMNFAPGRCWQPPKGFCGRGLGCAAGSCAAQSTAFAWGLGGRSGARSLSCIQGLKVSGLHQAGKMFTKSNKQPTNQSDPNSLS